MKRFIPRALAVGAVAVGVLSTASLWPAQASPTDIGGASLSNSTDYVNGTLAAANNGCVITSVGAPVTETAPAVEAEDTGAGTATCEDPGLRAFGTTITVKIQYFNGSGWTTAAQNSTPWPGVSGVSTGAGTVLAAYPTGSAALGRFHRAVTCVTTTLHATPACVPSLDVWYEQ